jgi:hypothetical protein
MTTSTQVPVSMRALLQRINRKLAKDQEVLKTLRGQRYENDLGRYYTVNVADNRIAATHVDPAMLGQELGVLAVWECVTAEEGSHGQ